MWTAFTDKLPCQDGQRKIVLGRRGWACGIVGLYTHHAEPVPLADALAEYDPEVDRYRDWDTMLPTHWAAMPDPNDIPA